MAGTRNREVVQILTCLFPSPGSKPPRGLAAGGLSPSHLSCSGKQGSPLRLCQELYSIVSVPEASLIFILLFESTVLWKMLQS